MYGVVREGDVDDLTVPEGGLKGATVSGVAYAEVSAIVSPLSSERVRSSRSDLSAHQRVVEFLAANTTILPLQFGVVMPSEQAVKDDLLEPNRTELALLLDEMAGKVELRLKATYLGDVALQDAVESHSSIWRLQHRIQSRGEAASYHDRIQLGELVAEALDRIKDDEAAEIVARLGQHARAVQALNAGREDIAFNAAFLVEETSRHQFDNAVDTLASDWGHRMSFQLVGPLAPWDFVAQDLAVSREPLPASSTVGRQ
ncbi:MAG: GvpL/GvpF family gas vesicle protein [Actinomycetota bacterium]|nr:GvpL/GvpF family gas vesicle protein [Actinomycetota bacterium]